MPKNSKSKCESASHRNLKEKTQNRVEDLQRLFSNLETARRENRGNDTVVFEEQVHQMLREWKFELAEPSPASSLIGGSVGFSDEIARLLQEYDLEDDATSPLGELTTPKPEPEAKPEPETPTNFQNFPNFSFSEDLFDAKGLLDHSFQGFSEFKATGLDFPGTLRTDTDFNVQLEHHRFDQHQDFGEGVIVASGNNSIDHCRHGDFVDVQPDISPPPSAFLGPKCALWDCSRPAQGSSLCLDYCSSCHAVLALNEGLPGVTPILRPGGLVVKDGTLFAALNLKMHGKKVGIPDCEGATSAKCPWNASELFDLCLLEGENVREWLFFDKPRRAFESGSRKQRSLPDYPGRGWHESRKQVMKEYGGQKRSYYMDPQPSIFHEWHLFEYEINNYSTCALYRLELKLVDGKKGSQAKVDGKKSQKGKVSKDSLADLQKKMGRLTAETPRDDSNSSLSGTIGSN